MASLASIVTVIARSTGTRTPCSERQPSSSTSVSLPFSAIARIDDRDGRLVGLRLKHEHAAQHADLRRRQADTACVLHQDGHAVDERLQVVVELRDLVRLQAQRAVAVLADLRQRELSSRLGLGVEARHRRRPRSSGSSSTSPWTCVVVVVVVVFVRHGGQFSDERARDSADRRRRRRSGRALPQRRRRSLQQLRRLRGERARRARLRDELRPMAAPEPRQRRRPEQLDSRGSPPSAPRAPAAPARGSGPLTTIRTRCLNGG